LPGCHAYVQIVTVTVFINSAAFCGAMPIDLPVRLQAVGAIVRAGAAAEALMFLTEADIGCYEILHACMSAVAEVH
jgi:hypothetical protein